MLKHATTKQINLSTNCTRQLIYNNDLAEIIIKLFVADKSEKEQAIYSWKFKRIYNKEIINYICKHISTDPSQISYNEKNNFSRSSVMSKLPFSFTYKPIDIAFHEMLTNSMISD